MPLAGCCHTIYDTHMGKQAISVTLDADNITWLKGRVGASDLRSVSELLDRLVTAARQRGDTGPGRSVVGTIDIDESDLALDAADAAVHQLFERSFARPLLVREEAPRFVASRPTRKKRRG